MKFQFALFVSAAATVCAAPAAKASIEIRDYPGLDNTQSRYALAIIERAKAEDVGSLGCVTAIATALTESDLYMCANYAVPASIGMAHDNVGADQDSVGLFQQRAVFYTDISCTMDPGCSAGLFFNDMKAVGNWRGMGAAALAQAIQRSEIPDAYGKYVSLATDVCNSSGQF
ncbi:hypothetical protein NLG97_g3183 [Lecanicillium saksenae]|uniref:Uncharacterized protein n=1 Tax=Lecanicillium saksenae TaxID=468837 RepID=A0ACC1R1I1_9HYPO|nr:hypothetical protein NLG97_g3183 [Lecanicillium saksenae]